MAMITDKQFFSSVKTDNAGFRYFQLVSWKASPFPAFFDVTY